MKSNEQNILNPKEEEIREYVEREEKEWEFSDCIYKWCMENAEKIELCKIEEKNVKGPIRTFLINWGLMSRNIGQLEKNDWKKLKNNIRDICKTLNKFKKSNLENCDIDEWKSEIKKCYEALDYITLNKRIKNIGPTSKGKILHLICPNFFPLWDDAIREKVSKDKECQSCKGIKSGSSEGYYKFMVEIKKFLKYHDSTLSELSKRHGKTKLRIIDEFMFCVAHSKSAVNNLREESAAFANSRSTKL